MIVYVLGAIFCLGYFIVLIMAAGWQTAFARFWLFLGIILSLAAIFKGDVKRQLISIHISLWLKTAIITFILSLIVIFLITELIIFRNMLQNPQKDVDYIIILGAKIWDDEPSPILQKRLDTSIKYLNKYPDTKVIVSGGKGCDEEYTEAQIMKTYLMANGILEDRIITEDRASNTAQNLSFSRVLIPEDNVKIAVVTTNFHVFRAVATGKKLGIEDISGISAPCDPLFQLNYLVRECIAVWKDKIVGNI